RRPRDPRRLLGGGAGGQRPGGGVGRGASAGRRIRHPPGGGDRSGDRKPGGHARHRGVAAGAGRQCPHRRRTAGGAGAGRAGHAGGPCCGYRGCRGCRECRGCGECRECRECRGRCGRGSREPTRRGGGGRWGGAAPSGVALQEVGVAPETAAHAAAAAAPGTALGVEPDAAAARSSAPGPVPVLVVGGSGYVAGEALRLLAGHPRLLVAGVVSESQAGQPVAAAFPHLASAYPDVRFHAVEELPRLIDLAAEVAAEGAALCAAPHGAAAKLVDLLLASAERAGARLRVVDLSADFRFAAAADYENVYGHAHGGPDRAAGVRCALPEHADLAFGTAAATAADAPPPLAAPWHIA